MPSNSSQMITILFFVAIGFLVGAALATWLAGRQKGEKPANRSEQPKPTTPPVGLNPQYYEEVASLWRSRSGEQLVVLRNGKKVETVTELADAQRKMMEQAVREWLVWLGLLPAKSAKPAVPSQPNVPTPVPPKPAPSAPPRVEALPPAVTPAVPAAPVEVKKVGSIVQQINDVLQENLREAGLTNRGVSLMEDPRQGVIVNIGLQRFIGIEAVPDPEIKALIQAAVKEWEQRTENGA